MRIEREALQRHWVHSHEEDTEGELVFRPEDYPFPPSRGRLGFDLKPDGTCVETAIGPADRPQEVPGTWELQGEDTLVFLRSSQDEPKRVMRISSASAERLVVSR